VDRYGIASCNNVNDVSFKNLTFAEQGWNSNHFNMSKKSISMNIFMSIFLHRNYGNVCALPEKNFGYILFS